MEAFSQLRVPLPKQLCIVSSQHKTSQNSFFFPHDSSLCRENKHPNQHRSPGPGVTDDCVLPGMGPHSGSLEEQQVVPLAAERPPQPPLSF